MEYMVKANPLVFWMTLAQCIALALMFMAFIFRLKIMLITGFVIGVFASAMLSDVCVGIGLALAGICLWPFCEKKPGQKPGLNNEPKT